MMQIIGFVMIISGLVLCVIGMPNTKAYYEVGSHDALMYKDTFKQYPSLGFRNYLYDRTFVQGKTCPQNTDEMREIYENWKNKS